MPKVSGPFRLERDPNPEPDVAIVRLLRALAEEFGGEIDLDDPDEEDAIARWLTGRIEVSP